MERNPQPLLLDVAVGMVAGLVATKATDLAQGPLRRATPDSVRRREELVSQLARFSGIAVLGRDTANALGPRVELGRLRRDLAGC